MTLISPKRAALWMLVGVAAASLGACSHGRNFAAGGPSGSSAPTNASDGPGNGTPNDNDPTNPGSPPIACPHTPCSTTPDNPVDPTTTPGTVGQSANLVTGTTGGLLAATGNLLLGVSDQTNLPVIDPLLNKLGNTVAGLGNGLAQDGLGAVPVLGNTLNTTVANTDSLTGNLTNVSVTNIPLLSGPTGATPAIGVSALSNAPVNGQLASVNALPQNGMQQLANVNIGGNQLLGQAGTPGAINAAISPNQLGNVVNTTLGGVQTTANGVLGGVTGGGALPGAGTLSGLTGAAGGGAAGGLTNVVNNVTSSVSGGAGAGLGGTVSGTVGGLTGGLTGGISGGAGLGGLFGH